MITLTRLIYVSRIAPLAKVDLAGTVAEVLRASRANNARAAVTGMLLTLDGFFVQALEGPDERVSTTFARVALDRRHTDVKVLGSDFSSIRTFGRWAMCANDLSAADDEILGVLGKRGLFAPYEMSAGAALKLLASISAIHTRQRASAA